MKTTCIGCVICGRTPRAIMWRRSPQFLCICLVIPAPLVPRLMWQLVLQRWGGFWLPRYSCHTLSETSCYVDQQILLRSRNTKPDRVPLGFHPLIAGPLADLETFQRQPVNGDKSCRHDLNLPGNRARETSDRPLAIPRERLQIWQRFVMSEFLPCDRIIHIRDPGVQVGRPGQAGIHQRPTEPN